MDTEIDTFPLFFQLIEQKGEKTETIIGEIKKLSTRFNLEDFLTLEDIIPTEYSNEENALIYKVVTNPNSKESNAQNVIDFLAYIFEKMFDRYPSYIEPPH